MAISYDNVSYASVIDPLCDLIAAEFRGHTTLRLFDDSPPKGSTWLELGSLKEELMADYAGSTTRRYTLTFSYVVKAGANSGKKQAQEETNFLNRLIELLRQNKDYTKSDVYCWHDATVDGIDYDADTEDDETNGHARVSFDWSCSVTHIVD